MPFIRGRYQFNVIAGDPLNNLGATQALPPAPAPQLEGLAAELETAHRDLLNLQTEYGDTVGKLRSQVTSAEAAAYRKAAELARNEELAHDSKTEASDQVYTDIYTARAMKDLQKEILALITPESASALESQLDAARREALEEAIKVTCDQNCIANRIHKEHGHYPNCSAHAIEKLLRALTERRNTRAGEGKADGK